MDYISRPWELISKKGNTFIFSPEKIYQKRKVDSSQKQISKKENFDGLYNHIISYSNKSHRLALQHGYYGMILNGLLKQVT